MNHYKVVIVDDEILAIQYIKQLICWEEHGFEVVAESANPEKALALCHMLKPDLVFVDIRMPVMDGLAFSKRLLDAGHPVKIILLTSYKEFEYAREAVKLGVVNYMLKHDVHADSLIAELSRIRVELNHEKLREGMIRRQVLNDMIAGRIPAGHQVDQVMRYTKSLGDELLLLLLQEDRPFPVMASSLETGSDRLETVKFNLPSIQNPLISMVEIIPFKAGGYVILLAAKRIPSHRELRESLFGVCKDIQSKYGTQCNKTASIFISRTFVKLTELSGICKEMEQLLRKSPRSGRNLIRFPGDPLLPCEKAEAAPAALFKAVEASLEEGDPASVSHSVERLFAVSLCDEALESICRKLIRIMDKYRESHGLEAMEKLMADGRIHTDSWYRANDIRDWFINLFCLTAENAYSHSLARYSKKIRQSMEYIHSHYAADLTTEIIAERLGISGDHLRHLFKEETGRTLLDYVTEVRMKKASELLLAGTYKVYEIAEMVGYKSSQYFSQVFRRKMGMNPLDYIEGQRQ